jgi:hypothetical protein
MIEDLIKYQDIYADQIGGAKQFPKYTTQIMNLANQNAQGTRPRVVGQMSDLITEFSGKSFDNWVRWYMDKHPNSIDEATNMVFDMVQKLATVIEKIDRKMVHDYIEDLVLAKTYVGFRFQQGIIRHLAKKYNREYRASNAAEESKGIDGFIGNTPVSIKPSTYKSKQLSEKIQATIIYYDKKKTGISIEYDTPF